MRYILLCLMLVGCDSSKYNFDDKECITEYVGMVYVTRQECIQSFKGICQESRPYQKQVVQTKIVCSRLYEN